MNSRLMRLYMMKNHPWMGRVYKKCSADEIKLMVDFICKNHSCDKGEFELRVNRMFLDNLSKPKRWKEIMEILSSCNL